MGTLCQEVEREFKKQNSSWILGTEQPNNLIENKSSSKQLPQRGVEELRLQFLPVVISGQLYWWSQYYETICHQFGGKKFILKDLKDLLKDFKMRDTAVSRMLSSRTGSPDLEKGPVFVYIINLNSNSFISSFIGWIFNPWGHLGWQTTNNKTGRITIIIIII